jgi:hypothetical protein
MFIVKCDLPAGIDNDELRGRIGLLFPRTEEYIVLSALAAKFPRGLEEFKELADNLMFGRICNDTDHRERT